MDTVENSPGFSNNMIGSIVSLELIRNLYHIYSIEENRVLKNQIAILFTNGAELNSLGAKSFIEKLTYPTSLVAMTLGSVKRLINLSSLGGTGKATLIQSSSLDIFTDYNNVPHPHASVIIEELASFLIQSEEDDNEDTTQQETRFITDFNILSSGIKDGVDVMLARDSYMLGTQFDNVYRFLTGRVNQTVNNYAFINKTSNVMSGAIQHLGDNLLAHILNIAKRDHDGDETDDATSDQQPIYFDFVGQFLFYCSSNTLTIWLSIAVFVNLVLMIVMPWVDHKMAHKAALNRSKQFKELLTVKFTQKKIEDVTDDHDLELLRHYNGIVDQLTIYFRFTTKKTKQALALRFILIMAYYVGQIISVVFGIFTTSLVSTWLHRVQPKSWYLHPFRGVLLYACFFIISYLMVQYLIYLVVRWIFSNRFGCFKRHFKQPSKHTDTTTFLNATERDRILSILMFWATLCLICAATQVRSGFLILLWSLSTTLCVLVVWIFEKLMWHNKIQTLTKIREELMKYFSMTLKTDDGSDIDGYSMTYENDSIHDLDDTFFHNSHHSVFASGANSNILGSDVLDLPQKQSPSQIGEFSPLVLTQMNEELTKNKKNRSRDVYEHLSNHHNNSHHSRNDTSHPSIIRRAREGPPTPFTYSKKIMQDSIRLIVEFLFRNQIHWLIAMMVASVIPSIITIDSFERVVAILIPFSGYSLLGLPGEGRDVPFPDWLFSSSFLTTDLLLCLVVVFFVALLLINFSILYHKSVNYIKLFVLLSIPCIVLLVLSLNDSTVFSHEKPQRIYCEQTSDFVFEHDTNETNPIYPGLVISETAEYYPVIELLSTDKSSLRPAVENFLHTADVELDGLRWFSGDSRTTFFVPPSGSTFSYFNITSYVSTATQAKHYKKHELTIRVQLQKSVHLQGLFLDLTSGPYIESFDLNPEDINYKRGDFYQDIGWSNYSRIFKYDVETNSAIVDIVAYTVHNVDNATTMWSFPFSPKTKVNHSTLPFHMGLPPNFLSQHEYASPLRGESAAAERRDNTLTLFARTFQCDWRSSPYGSLFFSTVSFVAPVGKPFCSFIQDTATLTLRLV